MLRLATLTAALGLIAAPVMAQTAGPLVRAGATEKVSTHVHVIKDMSAPGVPNVGFVVGTSGVLVIDTGMGPTNGKTVLEEAKKVAPGRKIYLVTTHVHPEHDLGAQAFPPDAVMIRAKAQVSEIAEEGMRTADAFRGRSEINKQLLEGAAFREADTTFDTSYELDLGGVKAKLFTLGPSHTQGDTGVYVEADKVLFSGDVAMKAMPAFASGKSSTKAWLTSLDKMDAMKPAIIVPSHGPVGDASYIAAYRTYITRIQTRAAALKKEGKSLEDATTAITNELKADGVDTGRAAAAIRTAYNEAS